MKRQRDEIGESEVTPEALYLRRRDFLRAAAAVSMVAAGCLPGDEGRAKTEAPKLEALANVTPAPPGPFRAADEPTPFESASTYNNFYEFGTDKEDPAANAEHAAAEAVVGRDRRRGREARRGRRSTTLLAPQPLEERIYRLRCVEAWSMVIPWVGYPARRAARALRADARRRSTSPSRRSIDPEQMPGQRRAVLALAVRRGPAHGRGHASADDPRRRHVRRTLPNQNGAPLRLVVPWKYGFKSIKSIVKIRLHREASRRRRGTSRSAEEYGFYANVNPEVDHPRWSQAKERRIGEFTTPADALRSTATPSRWRSLYAGMDLRRNY